MSEGLPLKRRGIASEDGREGLPLREREREGLPLDDSGWGESFLLLTYFLDLWMGSLYSFVPNTNNYKQVLL